MKNINVAILGFGTVGSGVYQVLQEDRDSIAARLRRLTGNKFSITIKKILVLDKAPYEQSLHEIMTTDIEDVLRDDIHIVCELIGGDTAANKYMKQAMDRGFHVVTANKKAIFTSRGGLIKYAAQKGVKFKYEASVAGAIPIIRAVEKSLVSDEIQEISGILNGSTNYILSQIKMGLTYEEALESACQKGYLESDPSSDILGYDAMYKLGILGNLLFGEFPSEEEIERQGIDQILAADIEYANSSARKIKLVGSIKRENGKIHYAVKPQLIAADNPLYNVDGPLNGILLKCKNAGELFFKGAGAGSKETAVSVIADIISIIRTVYARC